MRYPKLSLSLQLLLQTSTSQPWEIESCIAARRQSGRLVSVLLHLRPVTRVENGGSAPLRATLPSLGSQSRPEQPCGLQSFSNQIRQHRVLPPAHDRCKTSSSWPPLLPHPYVKSTSLCMLCVRGRDGGKSARDGFSVS